MHTRAREAIAKHEKSDTVCTHSLERMMRQVKPNSLKVEREMRGWSQSKIAELLGTTTKTVGRWERGETLPYPYYREQLCSLFGKNARQLGLLQDVDGESLGTQGLKETSVRSLLPFSPSALTLPGLLVDPAIPQALGHANSLLGRYNLFIQIKQHLFAVDNLTLTALDGLPGIGKTALAVAVASDPEIQACFCDGILWAGLGPHPNVLGQLARWGALLGVVPSQVEKVKSLEAWGQALRAAIGIRRMLLVIDDAWAAKDALALQIGGPQCAHLLTTRWPKVAYAFAQKEPIVVPQLEEANGLMLLARFVPQLIEQDPLGAQALVRAVDGLPLALTLIGNYLDSQTSTSQPLQAVLEQLHEIKQHLPVSVSIAPEEQPLSLVKTMPLALHAAITICDQQLSPQAHAALRALSVFPPKPASFSKEAALAVSQQSVETLDELWNVGLLENWGPERYTLHQAIADYVRAQDEAPVAHQQMVGNVQTYELDLNSSPDHALSYQSGWNIDVRHMKSIWALQPSMHFLSRPLPTLSAIFLALLVLIAVLLASNGLPPFKSGQPMGGPRVEPSIVSTDQSYEAEAKVNILDGDARRVNCSDCSGGKKIKNIGRTGTLQFNNVTEKRAGDHRLTIRYINGESGRTLYMSVNGEPAKVLQVSGTGNWQKVGTAEVTVHLNAGKNTIKFFNPSARGPDIDRIVV